VVTRPNPPATPSLPAGGDDAPKPEGEPPTEGEEKPEGDRPE
jgi:hypothetical protein